MERFYSALDAIIAMKKIRGVNTYCRLNNIDRRNFIAQRKDLERGWFQLSWLYPMVKEYGVSANGCLLDLEECLKNKNSPTQTLLVCMGLFLTNIPYHKLASHFLPDFVLSQIINAPVTTIPTVKIAPNISISIILKLYFLL